MVGYDEGEQFPCLMLHANFYMFLKYVNLLNINQ